MLLKELFDLINEASPDNVQRKINQLKDEIRAVRSQIANLPFASPAINTLKDKEARLLSGLKVARQELEYINNAPDRDLKKQQSVEFNKQIDLTQQERNAKKHDSLTHSSEFRSRNEPVVSRGIEFSNAVSKGQQEHSKRMKEHDNDWDQLLAHVFEVAKQINPEKFDTAAIAKYFKVAERTVWSWISAKRPIAREIRQYFKILSKSRHK